MYTLNNILQDTYYETYAPIMSFQRAVECQNWSFVLRNKCSLQKKANWLSWFATLSSWKGGHHWGGFILWKKTSWSADSKHFRKVKVVHKVLVGPRSFNVHTSMLDTFVQKDVSSGLAACPRCVPQKSKMTQMCTRQHHIDNDPFLCSTGGDQPCLVCFS